MQNRLETQESTKTSEDLLKFARDTYSNKIGKPSERFWLNVYDRILNQNLALTNLRTSLSAGFIGHFEQPRVSSPEIEMTEEHIVPSLNIDNDYSSGLLSQADIQNDLSFLTFDQITRSNTNSDFIAHGNANDHELGFLLQDSQHSGVVNDCNLSYFENFVSRPSTPNSYLGKRTSEPNEQDSNPAKKNNDNGSGFKERINENNSSEKIHRGR